MAYKYNECTMTTTPDGRLVKEQRRVDASGSGVKMNYVREETRPVYGLPVFPGMRPMLPYAPMAYASMALVPQPRARLEIEQDPSSAAGPVKPRARKEIQQKKRTVPKPKPLVKKKKTVLAGQCSGVKATGLPCTAMIRPGTRFCGTHQPKASRVDPICGARVAKTGIRCTTKKQGGSRWCGKHFNAWHGTGL